MLASIVGVLVFSGGVALATTITCQAGVDCLGTNNAGTLEGTAGKDLIHARGGADASKGFGDADLLYGQDGADTVLGGSKADFLIGVLTEVLGP